jgi:hypothetical protein
MIDYFALRIFTISASAGGMTVYRKRPRLAVCMVRKVTGVNKTLARNPPGSGIGLFSGYGIGARAIVHAVTLFLAPGVQYGVMLWIATVPI